MKYNIFDDFIEPLDFKSIKDTTTRDTFFWFYNDFVNNRPCKGYKFTNEIVKNSNLTHHVFINYLNMIKPVLEKIPHKKLHSVRFELFIKTNEQEKYLINHHKKNSKIAILFSNNTDGGIEIDNTFVKSKENKLLQFTSNQEYKIITSKKDKIFTYLLLNYE
tara:strand:+ start:2706 stop:3191 length:486 start_codon:yes stop_codon:yes gene_type:complete